MEDGWTKRRERRLIKGLNSERERMDATGGASSQGARGRGVGRWRPRGGPSAPRGRMHLRTRGPTTNNDTINLAEEEAGRGRLGSDRLGSDRLVGKRGRETAEMEEDGPPAKH